MSNGSEERAVTRREKRPPGPWMWPDEMERLFERAMRGPWPLPRLWRGAPRIWRTAGWVPDMDVFEREGATVVRIDLPGLTREDIEVSVQEDTLIIRGRRAEEKEVRDEDYYCSERAVGEFSRSISLPASVKPESVAATYQDGVLEVRVPAPEAPPETKSVKVEVK